MSEDRRSFVWTARFRKMWSSMICFITKWLMSRTSTNSQVKIHTYRMFNSWTIIGATYHAVRFNNKTSTLSLFDLITLLQFWRLIRAVLSLDRINMNLGRKCIKLHDFVFHFNVNTFRYCISTLYEIIISKVVIIGFVRTSVLFIPATSSAFRRRADLRDRRHDVIISQNVVRRLNK